MKRTFTSTIALFVLALFTAPAAAAWHEASSDHFLIYADSDERGCRVLPNGSNGSTARCG